MATLVVMPTKKKVPRASEGTFSRFAVPLVSFYFIGPTILIFIFSLLYPLLIPRYLLMTLPAFFLLVSAGLSKIQPTRTFIVIGVLLAMLFLPSLYMRLTTPRTTDYEGAAATIVRNAIPGDAIFVVGRHPDPRLISVPKREDGL